MTLDRDAWAALGLVAAATALRIAYGGWVGLAEDEAYYWAWGQRLAAGYFDHPPAIAWIIRAGTELLGDTERGVRLGAALAGGAAALLAAAAGRERLLVAFGLATMPLMALGGLLATPDVPLLLAWAGGLLAAARGRWALVGVAAGAAMLSKYTGVLLLPLLVAADPASLRTRGPYLAALIAVGVYAPNIAWNLQHDLVSWRFQLDHVAGPAQRGDFLGAQLGLAGPLLGLTLAAWWAFGWRGDRVERLCWWTSLPLLLVAIWAGGEANWAAPAWLSALVGAARRGGRWERAIWIGAGINLPISALVLVHGVRPLLELPNDPTLKLTGGRVLADSVAAWGVRDVYTERYQEAALIHFYSGIPAHRLPGAGRREGDQYDLWPVALADRALFVRPHRGNPELPVSALGYDWDEISGVSAYADTPDPLAPRLAARWDVAEIRR